MKTFIEVDTVVTLVDLVVSAGTRLIILNGQIIGEAPEPPPMNVVKEKPAESIEDTIRKILQTRPMTVFDINRAIGYGTKDTEARRDVSVIVSKMFAAGVLHKRSVGRRPIFALSNT